MLRLFPPWHRFTVLGFELRIGAETWFIGERRGGAGINLLRNEVSYSKCVKCVRKADLTFMGNLRFTPQMNLGD